MPHSTPTRRPVPFFHYIQATLFLGILCALFYTALDYYAATALRNVSDMQGLSAQGPQLGVAAFKRLLALRLIFTLFFCWLLGVVGWRITGTVWAAACVHAAAVLVMLWLSVPTATLLASWYLGLLLALVVGVLTLCAALLFSLRQKRKKNNRLR